MGACTGRCHTLILNPKVAPVIEMLAGYLPLAQSLGS